MESYSDFSRMGELKYYTDDILSILLNMDEDSRPNEHIHYLETLGTVSDSECSVFIDCGCSFNAVSLKLCEALDLDIIEDDTPLVRSN